MDMYVRLFEDRMRAETDNPTIGLILCTEKDETIVRYSVLKENRRCLLPNISSCSPRRTNCVGNWSVSGPC